MGSKVHEETLKIIVAQICQNIGFQGIFSSSVDVLIDLLHRYLKEIAVTTHRYSEQCGRTIPNLDDLGLAFQEMGISIPDLEEYVTYVEPISFPHKVPKLPIPRPSNLNFLKPGAREILSRPLYVHEHLPPMYPEKEEEEMNITSDLEEVDDSKEGNVENQYPLQESKPPEEEIPATKKLKFAPEEEGEPVREIDSVMMTTSGYISSAREGKMPESRRPSIPMPLFGGNTLIAKSPSSLIKKKATMEKIIRHKSHQGGILAGSLAKPKVKHMKKKPKIPLAPPGTGSLNRICAPAGGATPKLKIPNMNKEKEAQHTVTKVTPEKEVEKKKEKKKEGKDKKKKDKTDMTSSSSSSSSSSKKRKEERREAKNQSAEKKKERTRIRMRGLSKEEELRRYKERENELIAALAASSAVTVTSIPPPPIRVREKTPDKVHSESIGKNKLSVFRKFPKGPKDGERDSSPDLTIDTPVIKEEKPSPPPSPPPDIPIFHEETPPMSTVPPPPRTPEMPPLPPPQIHQPLLPPTTSSKGKRGGSPHKPKKEKTKEKKLSKRKTPHETNKGANLINPASPTWTNAGDFPMRERPITPEVGVPNPIENMDSPSIFNLPPFPHGPSLIPPPFSRFPFIPPFGVPPSRPPLPDLNMFMRSPPPPIPPEKLKPLDIMENLERGPPPTPRIIEERGPSPSTLPLSNIKSTKNSSPPEISISHSSIEILHQDHIPSENTKPEKVEKDKKKEHKREKKEKEKEKLKKKKEKKEREKKEKEDKKKEKERLKKERKEKKKISTSGALNPPSSSSESVPKLTLKFQNENDSNAPPSEKVMPKLNAKKRLSKRSGVIKPLLKHSSNETQFNPHPSEKPKKKKNNPPVIPPPPPPAPPSPPHISSLPPPPIPTSSIKSPPRESPGSPPEIAKFVPLVTRPPKGSQSKKNVDISTMSPPLKIKDTSSKEIKTEPKEVTVPPLKIKSSRANSPITTQSKFLEDKKSSSKKLEKKEKKKSSSLVITSLAGLDTADSTNISIPCPSQLPPPIPIPSEVTIKSSSKKSAAAMSSSSAPSSQAKINTKTSGLLTETVGPIGHFVDDQGNEVWICPTCGKQDDGSPMIGCDTCDDWYHWLCVGIHVPPSERENWYCPRCLSQHKQQQQGRGTLGVEKKKRGRKKKVVQ